MLVGVRCAHKPNLQLISIRFYDLTCHRLLWVVRRQFHSSLRISHGTAAAAPSVDKPKKTTNDPLITWRRTPAKAPKGPHSSAAAISARVWKREVESDAPYLPSEELFTQMDVAMDKGGDVDSIMTRLVGAQGSDRFLERLRDREEARKLAISLAEGPSPRRAFQVLLLSAHLNCNLKQNAYEGVGHRLAQARRWELILSVVSLGRRQTGRTTVRLQNWRLLALVNIPHPALLDNVLETFAREGLTPNRKTFHLLISGYIRNRDLTRARNHLTKMSEAGFAMDASTHAAIVSSYRSLGQDPAVRTQGLEALANAEDHHAAVIVNSILQMSADADDAEGMAQILSLFDQQKLNMPLSADSQGSDGESEHRLHGVGTDDHQTSVDSAGRRVMSPDVGTFTILLNHAARQGDLPKASRLYYQMQVAGVRPSAAVAAALVTVHYMAGDENGAVRIVADMCRNAPIPPILFRRLGLVDVSPQAKAEHPVRVDAPLAVGVFNALMNGVLEKKRIGGMRCVLRIMKLVGVEPDSTTAEIVVSYLDSIERVKPRELIRTLRLISAYTDDQHRLRHIHVICRAMLRAEKYLVHGSGWRHNETRLTGKTQRKLFPSKDEVSAVSPTFDPTAGVKFPLLPSSYSLLWPLFNSLITRRVRSDRATIALRIRRDAISKGNMESARQVFDTMLARGMHPNEYHFSALMEGYARLGQMRAARAMMTHAARSGIQPNAVMFTILIAGYARLGKPHLATRTFHAMVTAGVAPDVPAVDAVVSAFFAVRAYGVAKQVLLDLWTHVKPFPKELRDAPLKQLARKFRSGHNVAPVVPSEWERRILRLKLRKLLALCKSTFRQKPARVKLGRHTSLSQRATTTTVSKV